MHLLPLQESTSEAVNAYYGLYLLGEARGSAALADWGRVLLAMELRSAQRYWHVTTADAPQVCVARFGNGKVPSKDDVVLEVNCCATHCHTGQATTSSLFAVSF